MPGVTIMLAITIFSSIVGDMLPITDTTPLIGEHRPLQTSPATVTITIPTSETDGYKIYLKLTGPSVPGMYFSCIMFMVSSSCITTILILNYHHRLADTHEMPDWVAAVFLQWLPWLLHMSR